MEEKHSNKEQQLYGTRYQNPYKGWKTIPPPKLFDET